MTTKFHTDPFANWQQRGFSHIMDAHGLKVGLNSPAAPESMGAGLEESVQRLPPYDRRPAFPVVEYNCPPDWTADSPNEVHFFVPVFAEPPRHLWLDFNPNFRNPFHVAISISVQGMNPFTGKPMKGPALEQYRHECPVHHVAFDADLFCAKCGYKWPPQSYLATTGTKEPFLWLDGWRTEEGVVRGFLITPDVTRGIAGQVLSEARTDVIKCAFFLSKNRKPEPAERPMMFRGVGGGSKGMTKGHHRVPLGDAPMLRGIGSRGVYIPKIRRLEIGAGAKIEQRIARDPEDISFWRDQPECTIVIHYIPADSAWEIVQAGKVDRTAGGEGPLRGLRTGNPGGVW